MEVFAVFAEVLNAKGAKDATEKAKFFLPQVPVAKVSTDFLLSYNICDSKAMSINMTKKHVPYTKYDDS